MTGSEGREEVKQRKNDVNFMTSLVTMVTEMPQKPAGSDVTSVVGLTTTLRPLRTGHDLPVTGLAEGQLATLHGTALACIAVSFCCALAVILASFHHRRASRFFSWSKTERLVVYVAVFDLLFNVFHSMDHTQVLVTSDHVNPPELCMFYAFMLVQFIVGQILLINITAIDVCVALFANRRLNFGKWDWRILSYVIGAPTLVGCVCVATGQLGSTGAFCFFDAVRGTVANILCTSAFFWLVTLTDTALYVSTWVKLHREAKRHKATLGHCAVGIKATHKAARSMSMLVLAYLVQWWTLGMYGTWQAISSTPPEAFYLLSTSFANLGGLFNGVVYVILRRRKFTSQRSRRYTQRESRGPSGRATELSTVTVSSTADTAASDSGFSENHV